MIATLEFPADAVATQPAAAKVDHGAIPTFDYIDLSPADAKALERHAKAIVKTQDRVRRVRAEGVLAIGKELAAVQSRLADHHDGVFTKWIKERCGFTPKSAYRVIRAYRVFGSCDNLSQLKFDASALYILSAKSTPEDATAEALKLAEQGEHITHQRAIEIVGQQAVDDPPTELSPFELVKQLVEALDSLSEKWPAEHRGMLAGRMISYGEEIEKGIGS